MERELKFRAWDPKTGIMYYTNKDYTVWAGGLNASVANNGPSILLDDVMQYSGLKDKNGKEIYEGDIVRLFHGHPSWLIDPFYVIFQCSAFALKKKDKSGSTAFATYLHDCVTTGIIMNDDDESALFEVIGNVWQNPELINKATS